jgi:hypothetical protein
MAQNFRINAVRLIQSGISVLLTMSNQNQEFFELNGGYTNHRLVNDPKNVQALSQAVADVRSLGDLAESAFGPMNCIHINQAIRSFRRWADYDEKTWSELRRVALALVNAIDNELKDYIFYQYPKGKAEKLGSFDSDWALAMRAFPSVHADAFSATDCYAMGHNTAAVFHCMRVLERGIAALAGEFGLNFDIQNWQNIIDQIESKIAEQRKTLSRGAEKNERLSFLSEAAKEFFYFKDGWRNYVSHNRGRYDDSQALSILDHTRFFMCHLASQLSE